VEALVLQRLPRARKTGKIGGFAETLLMRSEIPVLVVGRHHLRRARAKGTKARRRAPLQRIPAKILLALDLEGELLPLLDRVGEWARGMKAAVHLYHSAAPFPVAGYRPTADIYPGDWSGPVRPVTLGDWQGDLEARGRELDRLAKYLRRKGVRCTVELDSNSPRAAEGVLKSRRKNRADWIAVAGKSSRWSALILGSVSRVVAREADCPVWVVHVETRARGRAEAPAKQPRAA